MRVAVLQHAEFEGPGAVIDWVQNRQGQLELVKTYSPAVLYPDPTEVDLVVILGGPMNTDQLAQHPWLAAEKRFIRSLVASDTPVLGICLGAQLLAEALGGTVTDNPEPEIGWFPIIPVAAAADGFSLTEPLPVLHWHSQTFSVPAQARRFAESAACPNQGFEWQNRIIGLQFHPEYNERLVADTIAHLQQDLQPREFVQSAVQIAQVPSDQYRNAHRLLFAVLDYLLASGANTKES